MSVIDETGVDSPISAFQVDDFLLKAIVDAAADGIVVIDEEGHIEMANPATERLFGYPVSELVGRNVSMLMPEPYRAAHNGYLRNYLETGERKILGVGREVLGRRCDGSTFPMYLSVTEVRYDDRRYFAGMIHDLSAQKATEEALLLSEQHLRDVTEAASDWTWETDTDGRLVYVSGRFYELTGVAPGVVVGHTRWELAGESSESAHWRSHVDDLRRRRAFRDFVYSPRFESAPDREFYIKISGKPVFDESGRFVGYRGTGTDVTEKMVSRRALRESRRTLDTLMSNVPGMVYRCRNDPDWTMEFVSGGGERLTGCTADKLVSGEVSFGSLIHPDDRQGVWEEVQAAIADQRPFEMTYRIRSITGEEKWVWEHGSAIFGDDGELWALEGLIVDISERRQTELALQALAGATIIGDGEDFTATCVRQLARTYGAKYAFVGVFEDARRTSIQTLAFWQGKRFGARFRYDLAGTPCEEILNCRGGIVPRDAARRYPGDRLLQEWGIESYFGAPLVDSSGRTIGLVAVMDDRPMRPNLWTRSILGVFAGRVALELERQRSEESLRESEAYMRLTLDNAPIGIASADLDGRLLDVNPAFAGLLGYTREELVGMGVDNITHPEDREETHRHFVALINGEISGYELEKRYLRRGGDVIHVRARAGLVRDADGRPVRVIGQVEDETERRHAAQEIQRMRSYLKNIIDSMPSLLVGVDSAGRVTEWNRSAELSTGVDSKMAVGQSFAQLFPQLAGQMDNVTEAICRQQPIHTERLPWKMDGETRYAEVMVYPLLANGSLGAVIRMDDITERIRIEQMMVQTEKMLSVGGLAAGMAHEISNPLSIVLQSAQNALRRVSPDLEANRAKAEELGLDLTAMGRYLRERGVVSFIEGVQEAGARASRIVADMLAFSRRSSSQLAPNRIDEMLETVLRLAASDYDLKKKYDFRQIEIARDYDPDLGEVWCDSTQIEQVLLNLVKNAAHAMAGGEAGSRCIALRTRREGGDAVIEVADSGPGMDEATRKRAFEPFFTTKPVGVGTGLGLSVSYFIVTEQHKGSISVSSRPGKGCRFTIRLPLGGEHQALP